MPPEAHGGREDGVEVDVTVDVDIEDEIVQEDRAPFLMKHQSRLAAEIVGGLGRKKGYDSQTRYDLGGYTHNWELRLTLTIPFILGLLCATSSGSWLWELSSRINSAILNVFRIAALSLGYSPMGSKGTMVLLFILVTIPIVRRSTS